MGNSNSAPVTPQTIYKAASSNNVQLLIVSGQLEKMLGVDRGGIQCQRLKCDGARLQEVLRKVPGNQLYQFLEPQDEIGWTPLMVASSRVHTAAVQEVRFHTAELMQCHVND